MEIESLFNGDVRRSIPCAPANVFATLQRVAIGDGWGVRIVGSEADLLAIGAYRPAEPQDDRVMLLDLGDTYIDCRVA